MPHPLWNLLPQWIVLNFTTGYFFLIFQKVCQNTINYTKIEDKVNLSNNLVVFIDNEI